MMVEVDNMNDAVRMAQRLTEKGDAVLLSPACASFDLFENYEDRGINLSKRFTILKQKSIFFKLNNTNEGTNKQVKRR
jgi:UDP-N-acetylmuramoylalanine-D-glutamate ligase